MNDAIAGNFQVECLRLLGWRAGSAGLRGLQRVSARTRGRSPARRPSPNSSRPYYDAAAIVDPQQRIAAFKQVFEVLHETAWAVPICMRGLLCGQSKQISGVVYDAKTHLVYQGIVKS